MVPLSLYSLSLFCFLLPLLHLFFTCRELNKGMGFFYMSQVTAVIAHDNRNVCPFVVLQPNRFHII